MFKSFLLRGEGLKKLLSKEGIVHPGEVFVASLGRRGFLQAFFGHVIRKSCGKERMMPHGPRPFRKTGEMWWITDCESGTIEGSEGEKLGMIAVKGNTTLTHVGKGVERI